MFFELRHTILLFIVISRFYLSDELKQPKQSS